MTDHHRPSRPLLFRLLYSLTLALFAGTLAAAPAPTGMIEGRVLNSRSGAVAENARVSVEGTSLVTFTDSDGLFRLTEVPAGPARIRVFYTGFNPLFEAVTVSAGQTLQRDITLADTPGKTDSVVKLDAFSVSETREMEGAAIAINEQRFASNVKTVVSTDEFGAVAEGNVAEFLRYLPGLTIDLSGGDARTVSIDGAPAENTPITLAGISLPSSNSTGRQVEAGMFNSSALTRTATPGPTARRCMAGSTGKPVSPPVRKSRRSPLKRTPRSSAPPMDRSPPRPLQPVLISPGKSRSD